VRSGAIVILAIAAVLGIQPAFPGIAAAQAAAPVRILFLRGAPDTVGADGVDNNQLSDIADLVTDEQHGKGYGVWTQMLLAKGYEVAQLEESGGRDQAEPVDLTTVDLRPYKAIVFGSNNARYTPADVKVVTDFVAKGGGVLFMADRNWGPVTGRASTSDDFFLSQWGITEQQDNAAVEDHTSADYLDPGHPILQGVNAFSSFGVSACTVGTAPATAGLTTPPSILVPYLTTVHVNDVPDGEGTQRPPGPTDGALVVAQPGKGRVACFFDRDPFFNVSINDPKHQHAKLGVNLIDWVAGKS
jgi:hypothetical protein